MVNIFRSKLQSLRTEDKQRVDGVVDGRTSGPSYNLMFENGIERPASEVAEMARDLRTNFMFAHLVENDVSIQ
jgi:hypothetical protein